MARQIDGETMETVADFIFLCSRITVAGDYSHEIKRYLLLGRKAVTHLDSILKSRDITLPTKICLIKARFSSSHIWIWELDHKKGWVPLYSWCFQTVVLEKTLESLLDCREIKPVIPKVVSEWVKSLSHVQLLATPWTVATRLLHPWTFQARVLEWVAISFSRGSSRPKDWTQVFCIAGRYFTDSYKGSLQAHFRHIF